MDFSIFFFSSAGADSGRDKYRLLTESARFADHHGFTAIWTPERHFDSFGGLYPNPSVTSAALAMITDRIRLRAGSVVMPLQDPLRVAEEWAVVDNLSGGRAELSFASGWHANDFVLAPQAYPNRRQVMLNGIGAFMRLWAGEPLRRSNGEGTEVETYVYPRPLQASVPVWLTCQSDDTFGLAGEMGLDVVTNFSNKRPEDLAAKIRIYRRGRQRGGYDAAGGRVALMMHSYVAHDPELVRSRVRDAYLRYIHVNLELQSKHFGTETTGEERERLVENAVDRLLSTNGLVGTPRRCREIAVRMAEIGVTEIACLIDFGIDPSAVLEGLPLLAKVREECAALAGGEGESDW